MTAISIAPTDRVFVLTGAGISAESGLPTFRADDGLWAGNRIEDVCTPEAWERNPELVWQFYSKRRADGAKAQPNPAHFALAELEKQHRRPLFPLHAKCRRPARTRRLRPPPPHARRTEQSPLRARLRPPSRRRPQHLRQPRRSRPLPLRRPSPPPHRLLRRDPLRDGPHPARDRQSHADAGRRHLRLRLSGSQFCPLGQPRAERAPSTSAPSPRSTPLPSRMSSKAKPEKCCPALFQIE